MEAGQKIWFITGTSSGFGKRLAALVLARGDYVIATVRRLDCCPQVDADQSRLRILVLDVSDSIENVQATMDEALSIWGRIDVVVNNAGYGMKAMIEEGGSVAALTQFQTNLFGAINVTNAILPHMRKRRSGTVLFMGTRSVWNAGTPAIGFYASSKAALHGVAETYAAELAQFNVRIMIVAPGAFRTENVHSVPYTMNTHVPDYDEVREDTMAHFREIGKKATGDPAKAMELVVDVVRGEGKAKGREMPLYLFLGNVTYVHVRAHCEMLLQTMDAWEDVAKDLDFDPDD
ncbi:hypothetical protein AcW1_005005 [Taiwanofungus camphoratus]|nr:hypothetical protein AcW2_005985 [Antrodia cinnamomea]KAI0941228.1 hypothetical protein AcV7_002854 [Antrodia cinnamomea]KAI0960509.1 hypothetical protein AcW1_005005 [Antrodia cinnamomea]